MKTEKIVKEMNKCCGCGACMIICPKQAIKMKKDSIGNIYPHINIKKCVGCGLCNKACNYRPPNTSNINNKCYAAFSTNNEILTNSSSGGTFGTIARQFILEEGLVCGCHLNLKNGKFVAEHIIINNIDDINKILGSKYVQSNVFKCFQKIKEKLISGKNILFAGTPCQVAGLKGFLGKDYDNLYTIDLICHGVPNNKIFQNYIEFLEQKKNIKILDIKFRDKSFGWGLNGKIEALRTNSGKTQTIPFCHFESSYYTLFKNGYLYRENCYSCPFAQKNRIGDITIGDFWGVEDEMPKFKRKSRRGVSCIIINTRRGEKLINDWGSNIKKFSTDFVKISRHNNQLNVPTKKPSENDKLIKEYEKNGYSEVENFYLKKLSLPLWQKRFSKIKIIIQNKIRKWDKV